MSHTAVLRFAPAYDTRHLVDDSAGAPELIVGSAALKRVRHDTPTPVIVDHDFDRVIGHVRDLYIAEDVDYGTRVRKWWFASCEITDPPSWLKRGGAVSWSYHELHAREVGGTTVLECCLLREISLLSPATEPAEALARVRLVEATSDRSAAGEVILGGETIIRRNVGQVLGVR